MISLNQYGFGPQLSMKIYQAYESETLQKIEENPYQLVKDVEGLDLLKQMNSALEQGYLEMIQNAFVQPFCIPLRQQACKTVIRTYKRKI